jgi:hypothetical protein
VTVPTPPPAKLPAKEAAKEAALIANTAMKPHVTTIDSATSYENISNAVKEFNRAITIYNTSTGSSLPLVNEKVSATNLGDVRKAVKKVVSAISTVATSMGGGRRKTHRKKHGKTRGKRSKTHKKHRKTCGKRSMKRSRKH